MLRPVRTAITAAGNPLEVTPGRRTSYSREEVSDTLARKVMAQGDSMDEITIAWNTARGHQFEGKLKAIEVRINLDRPTGGRLAMTAPIQRSSPHTDLLQDRKDNFHTHLLSVQNKFPMNIVILRLMTIVAIREYLLIGVEVPSTKLIHKVSEEPITDTYNLDALYDSTSICVEAVKGVYKANSVDTFFRAEDKALFVKDLKKETKRQLWLAIIPHFNLSIMEEAAKLIYKPCGISRPVFVARIRELDSSHGSSSFYDSGSNNAITLDSIVVNDHGIACEGHRYMQKACSLVVETGVITLPFMKALLSERFRFNQNRIEHIEAKVLMTSGGIHTPSAHDYNTKIKANVRLANDTFGSKKYKESHDTDLRTKKR
jgi:hypothetical protein